MESMDGGVLISPDCARLIVDLSDALEGGQERWLGNTPSSFGGSD